MIFAEDGRLTVGENDGWSITGNLSYDDEPVEYLWVVNDDRSWRGLTSSIKSTLRNRASTPLN